MGVWIEIPSTSRNASGNYVAPFVGVWIEIADIMASGLEDKVAPFVGVWIEIIKTRYVFKKSGSLPSWECGLKFAYAC